MASELQYPAAVDPSLVGTYPASVFSGGGFVWDAVLEYRVWCHPESGDDDHYFAFSNYSDALKCSQETKGAEDPLALVLQNEYIDEPEPGDYIHVRKKRMTEWPVEYLSRPKRTDRTIPDFLSPGAPSNKLDVLRGIAKPS